MRELMNGAKCVETSPKNNKMRGAERLRVALASRTEGGAGRERPDAANLDDAVVARVLAVRVRRGRDAIERVRMPWGATAGPRCAHARRRATSRPA